MRPRPGVREMKEDGELPRRVKVRSSQYLNNLVEQDHSESEATNPADALSINVNGVLSVIKTPSDRGISNLRFCAQRCYAMLRQGCVT